jgi:hypothetical protein
MGLGLGVCLGVGLGVGILTRSLHNTKTEVKRVAAWIR